MDTVGQLEMVWMNTGIINSSLEMRNGVVESKMSDNLQANIFISIRFETCAKRWNPKNILNSFIFYLFFLFVSAISDFGLWDVQLVYQKLKFYLIFIQFNHKIYKPYFVVLTFCSDMQFSTRDNDNDEKPDGSCAQKYQGAWWYSYCLHSNLNGLYLIGSHFSFGNGVNWKPFKGYHYSLKSTEMKVK